VAGASRAEGEGGRVAVLRRRVDVKRPDQLLARRAAVFVARRHCQLDVIAQGRVEVERVAFERVLQIVPNARRDRCDRLARIDPRGDSFLGRVRQAQWRCSRAGGEEDSADERAHEQGRADGQCTLRAVRPRRGRRRGEWEAFHR